MHVWQHFCFLHKQSRSCLHCVFVTFCLLTCLVWQLRVSFPNSHIPHHHPILWKYCAFRWSGNIEHEHVPVSQKTTNILPCLVIFTCVVSPWNNLPSVTRSKHHHHPPTLVCLLDISILLLGSGSNAINMITIKQTARAVKQYLSNIYISSF